MTRVLLFGIDGAPPELVFDKWKNILPNISKLMSKGAYAKMNSTIPPSTIVAWNAMLSGKDSSEIGVFSYTYKDADGTTKLVNSTHIKCKLLWDMLGKRKKTIALYIPLSYPVKPINGVMVSDFLTPMVNERCASPPQVIDKLRAMKNQDIFFDVVAGLAGHKGLDVGVLLERTYAMTDMQIGLLKEFVVGEWDFFASVMIGTDRLQHMLWQHFDETHRRYIPNSPYRDALKKYYSYLDSKLGEVLELLDNDTVIIVASDHGMIKQEGKININTWLINQGYLVLKQNINIKELRKFSTELIDMDKSLAWGGGAYNARVIINKPKAGNKYNQIRDEIAKKLCDITDDKGNPMETKVYVSENIYKDTSHPECPDLIVYFDALRWASNPDLGHDSLYSWKTAVGADSAGHSAQGCFIISGKGIAKKGLMQDINIQQVAPTILKLLGEPVPKDITVQSIEVT